jgi:hypothetical protein
MLPFHPADYGPVLAGLLQTDRDRELGPGRPDLANEKSLDDLTLEKAFADRRIVDRDMAQLCLAGVWLLHDYLDESHTISQNVATPTGSYWHGVMHRREPDFSNSKYWFRRVGEHPVFESLLAATHHLAVDHQFDDEAAQLVAGNQWDPYVFVDLCEAVARGQSNNGRLCRAIQRRECELLFDYCYRAAVE